MSTDSFSRLAEAKRKADDGAEMAAKWKACQVTLAEIGWSEEDIQEVRDILKVDLAPGAGVERPFPMTLEERRACWLNWFNEYIPKTRPLAIATKTEPCQVVQ